MPKGIPAKGARKAGAGRRPGPPTVTVSFRVPIAYTIEVRAMVRRFLYSLKINVLTDKQKEAILNLKFSTLKESEAVEKFTYMTSETRLKHTSESNIRKQWREKRLGSMLKRMDRERFDAIKL